MLYKAKSLDNSMIEVDEFGFCEFVDIDCHQVQDLREAAPQNDVRLNASLVRKRVVGLLARLKPRVDLRASRTQ